MIVGVIVLCAVVIIGAVWYWRSTFYESTDDAYIEGHPVFVSARVSGNLIGIHVADNQYVKDGALLAEIDPCDYEARLAQTQAGMQAAMAAAEQNAADAEVARATLARDEQDLHRYEALVKADAAAFQDLQHSQAAMNISKANLDAAQKRLATAHAQVTEAKAAAEQARLQLSYTRVYAPQAGYVTRRMVEKGSYVDVGQPLLAIVTGKMYVTANFKETQLTHMRPGQPATVRVDAYPSLSLRGHVESIQAGTGAVFSLFPPENATGNFVKVVQRVPVRIVFDERPDPNHHLALGMSVRPKVRVK